MSSDGSESDSSDIKIKSALLKTGNKKMPTSPTHYILKKQQDKKMTTKVMIIQALVDLKSRKGVSLYAIKKYITEKYGANTEKLNYYIKKYLKSEVEKGTIIQTKGIGASGSFKLAPVKENKPKAKKPKKEKAEKEKKSKDPEKKKIVKEKLKKTEGKSLKSKVKAKGSKDKPVKGKKKMDGEKLPKEKKLVEKKDGEEKVKKVTIAKKKDMKTPLKKRAMMKRKSIGSIIKQPKMKPSAKA